MSAKKAYKKKSATPKNMPAKKSAARKNTPSEASVEDDPKIKKSANTVGQLAKKDVLGKGYPIIYSYIYERETSDMKRIFKEHEKEKNQSEEKPVEAISGFKVVNGELVPIIKKARKKK